MQKRKTATASKTPSPIIFQNFPKIPHHTPTKANKGNQRDGSFGLLTTTSGDISKSIHTISSEILADLDVFNEICYGVAHKLIDSSYRNAILIY